MAADRQFCTFALGDDRFGVDAALVREILPHRPMTRVPLAPPAVSGLLNLRGQVVPAIDLRRCLDLPPRPGPWLPANLVVRVGDRTASFQVDSIHDVLKVDATTFEPAPEALSGVAASLILGLYKLSETLLLVLDAGRVLDLVADYIQANEQERSTRHG